MNSLPFLKVDIIFTFLGIVYKKSILSFYPTNVCAFFDEGKHTRIFLSGGRSFLLAMNSDKYMDSVAAYEKFVIEKQTEMVKDLQNKREVKNKLKLS